MGAHNNDFPFAVLTLFSQRLTLVNSLCMDKHIVTGTTLVIALVTFNFLGCFIMSMLNVTIETPLVYICLLANMADMMLLAI